MRVYEYGALVNSTDFTNLIVDEFNTSMENTCSDASWINIKNEIQNISIHNMVRTVLIDINRHEKNGDVQHRHNQKFIDANSTVH